MVTEVTDFSSSYPAIPLMVRQFAAQWMPTGGFSPPHIRLNFLNAFDVLSPSSLWVKFHTQFLCDISTNKSSGRTKATLLHSCELKPKLIMDEKAAPKHCHAINVVYVSISIFYLLFVCGQFSDARTRESHKCPSKNGSISDRVHWWSILLYLNGFYCGLTRLHLPHYHKKIALRAKFVWLCAPVGEC